VSGVGGQRWSSRMTTNASSSLPAGGSPVWVVAMEPSSRLAAVAGNGGGRSPVSKALQGEATEQSAASSEACRAVNFPRESRALFVRVKAMEGVKNMEVQPRSTPRRMGRGMLGR
jgi:hypothetical protein